MNNKSVIQFSVVLFNIFEEKGDIITRTTFKTPKEKRKDFLLLSKSDD